ncbi:integrase core domain-containing protein [Pelagimonas phthalicica]|uniref:integrase core domain-containing protein n=1 Tax=Pelagimonas phthalicica TaxID=1037362 RepID=UPI000C06F9AC|nr:integrase core domain-containing protein [Pelagimonas phthalicica]
MLQPNTSLHNEGPGWGVSLPENLLRFFSGRPTAQKQIHARHEIPKARAECVEVQDHARRWLWTYNTNRPHCALRYRPPASETIVQVDQRPIMQLDHSSGAYQLGLARS